MTTDADPGATGGGTAGEGEENRIKTIEGMDTRLTRIEDLLKKVLPGGKDNSEGDSGGTPPAPASSDPVDVREAVRAELGKLRSEEQADAEREGDKTWRSGVDQTLEQLKAERQPREPSTGLRGAARRVLLGRDPL